MNLHQKLKHGNLTGAHRGHRALFPENTMAAFLDCPGKCDFIEFDIRFTKDMIPVVFHDRFLDRTSDIQTNQAFEGQRQNELQTFTFSQLQKLDIGSWFYNEDPFNTILHDKAFVPKGSAKKQIMIQLSTLLELASQTNMYLNIELKCLHYNAAESARLIVDTMRKYSISEQCVISSFDHEILRCIKEIDSCISTAALVEQKHPDNLLHYLHELGVDGYNIDDELANIDLINTMNSNNIFVGVYTVNSKKRKEELLHMGANAVITDFLY